MLTIKQDPQEKQVRNHQLSSGDRRLLLRANLQLLLHRLRHNRSVTRDEIAKLAVLGDDEVASWT